jgi:hypothetical protein
MGYILIITNQLLRDQTQLAGDPPLPPLITRGYPGSPLNFREHHYILDLSYKKWKFNDVHGPTTKMVL